MKGVFVQNVMFYENPVLLDKNVHKDLCLTPSEPDFTFAAKSTSVILALVEFVPASWDYPIAFTRATDGEIVPVALLGIRRDENLFVAEGKWRRDTYIPAFVRRYPFIPAQTATTELAVCIDDKYPGFAAGSGTPLFDEKGEPAPLLEQAIELMQDYDAECKRTASFMRVLGELDLLKELSIRIEMKDGASFALSGVLGIDETKFAKLPKDAVWDLHRAGYLAPIYAHLFSQVRLKRLIDLLAERLVWKVDLDAAGSTQTGDAALPVQRSLQ
jgi:hypothetical protein